jgi:para-nitrobenzyl esterase
MPLGELRGVAFDGYERFAGIRYAQAPTGDLRFRAPKPVQPWEGTYDATEFGASAMQPPPLPGSIAARQDLECDEDCLFLNVYTPKADDGRRPVMVWVHGGAYLAGSGDTYDGSRFMHGDVVVVTVNYRLGVFGWMPLEHLDQTYAGSGNNGILDLVESLRWVRDNIAAFGGNPDDVTIFGESAGGGCIFGLLAAPAADGLYHKAIVQSGGPGYGAPQGMEDYVDAILSGIGAPDGGIDALHAASADELIAAQTAENTFGLWGSGGAYSADGAGRGIHPTVDGVVITRSISEALRAKGDRNVPLIVGTNRDEGTLFGAMLAQGRTHEQLCDGLRNSFKDPARVLAAIQAAETGHPLIADVFGQGVIWIPSIVAADAQAETNAPVWVYQFRWETPVLGGALGATHGIDIPFTFNELDTTIWKPLLGDNPPQDLARVMHETFIAFARDGFPSHPDLPDWPPYDTAIRPTMEFGDKCRVTLDPDGDLRAAWMD